LSGNNLRSLNNTNVFCSVGGFGGNVAFSLGVVNNLSLNGDVLDSLMNLLNSLFFHVGLLNFPSDVFNLSFHCIVISDSSGNSNSFISNNLIIFNDFTLNWDLIDLLDLLIFHIFLFKGNIFNSALHGDILSHDLVSSTQMMEM